MPFDEWFESLKDRRTEGIIIGRIDRIEAGNLRNCEPVGEGVFELKIDYGPGYRVYFGEDGDLVVLLYGGDKSTQDDDINTAKAFWSDYNA